MNDFDVMSKCRGKWCRERGEAGMTMPDSLALAAYHRGFMDALNVALGRVILEDQQRDAASNGGKE